MHPFACRRLVCPCRRPSCAGVAPSSAAGCRCPCFRLLRKCTAFARKRYAPPVKKKQKACANVYSTARPLAPFGVPVHALRRLHLYHASASGLLKCLPPAFTPYLYYPVGRIVSNSSWLMLTVCCISMAFAYGFCHLPTGLQKASFYSVKGYLLKAERPRFAGRKAIILNSNRRSPTQDNSVVTLN